MERAMSHDKVEAVAARGSERSATKMRGDSDVALYPPPPPPAPRSQPKSATAKIGYGIWRERGPWLWCAARATPKHRSMFEPISPTRGATPKRGIPYPQLEGAHNFVNS